VRFTKNVLNISNTTKYISDDVVEMKKVVSWLVVTSSVVIILLTAVGIFRFRACVERFGAPSPATSPAPAPAPAPSPSPALTKCTDNDTVVFYRNDNHCIPKGTRYTLDPLLDYCVIKEGPNRVQAQDLDNRPMWTIQPNQTAACVDVGYLKAY
jgi:hypothetical protein